MIQEELGLEAPPTVVVAATVKDVQGTAARLGFRCAGGRAGGRASGGESARASEWSAARLGFFQVRERGSGGAGERGSDRVRLGTRGSEGARERGSESARARMRVSE